MDVLILLVNEINCWFYIESIKKRFFKVQFIFDIEMGEVYGFDVFCRN